MQSLWNEQEAKQFSTDLELRVYTSRLLGRDKSLVLHGGGNTSVKITETNILGNQEEMLYVKGSGWDLETIEQPGFSPVRLRHLIELAKLESLSDMQMVNELRTQMTIATAPTPSVEAILHATIPYKFVDHTHADAVISITNTLNGLEQIQSIYGDDVVIIPYVMPGFDLARLCAEQFGKYATEKTIGMILMNHGVFSFGDDARQSYERMIELVSRAENFLKDKNAWELSYSALAQPDEKIRLEIAQLRYDVSQTAGHPMLLTTHHDDRSLHYVQNENIEKISQQGPATPDHVIRTKRIPLIGRDVNQYSNEYIKYFDDNNGLSKEPKSMLDTCPRIVLDKQLGLCSIGRSMKDAAIVADIYQHTIDIILRAEKLGGYQALPAKDIFDVEYWDLEQAKLKKSGASPVFSGEVALVTGAASGIGKACVDSLLKRGCTVVGIDINPDVTGLVDAKQFLGIQCDVTDATQINAALEEAVRAFGGLDILVLNAGTFPAGCKIEEMTDELWKKVISINLDANLSIMRECYPLLRLSPRGARVAIIGSKNVAAPGPGAAAYSASKAALTQLARVATLEWGAEGIRINIVHPDAVFDTGIWSDEVLQSRADHYGISVDEYKKKNLLKVEVNSSDVAELVAEICGPLFSKTTGAQIPIDGGNDRVI
ncbi:MAG: bifunctional aldolase/short-chain dehydrogenase [Gammaproteobacteria bacterium]